MARLPKVGDDKGTWGGILNDYLSQSHNDDGTLKNDTVGAPQLRPQAVTSAALANGAVNASKLASSGDPTTGQALTYNGSSLAWSTITSSGSVPDATDTDKGLVRLAGDIAGTANYPLIAADAITEAKLDSSVRTKLNAGIADGTVTTAKLADDTVTEAKLDAGVRGKLNAGVSDGGVTTAKLADDAVTAAKLADSAVTTAAIAAGAVTVTKLQNAAQANGPAILDGVGKLPASAVPMQAVVESSELKATYVTLVDAGTNLSVARPESAALVLFRFDAGVDVGVDAANVVNRREGDLVVVAESSLIAPPPALETHDPTAESDSIAGYSAGQTWVNTVTADSFMCVSAAANAAVWRRLSAKVDVFTESGTWTKPSWASTVEVAMVGPGGGGGSGAVVASGTACSGGAGGGGGAFTHRIIPAALVPFTVTVTAPAGGAGGAAQTGSGAPGSDGTPGTTARFGSLLSAAYGGGGQGGKIAATATGGAGALGLASGTAGGTAPNGAAGSAVAQAAGGPGGGGGGGISSAPAAFAGSNGTSCYMAQRSPAAVGGTAGGGAGGAGLSSTAGDAVPGSSGAGGGSNTTGGGGAGGAGGQYGAGGGGGGAALNGSASGAGGKGGDSIVVVVTR